jgi:hypothetical protein
MDAEFSVLGNAAKVKVSLTEFEAIAGHLLGVSKRAEVRQALKELIEEVRKSADTFMDVLSPLFALTAAPQFSKLFPQIRANFKGAFLKEGQNLRTHCHIVTEKLNSLNRSRRWMEKLPIVRRSFERLHRLSQEWIADDSGLELSMATFLNSMDRLLDKLERERKKDSKNAFSHLQEFLEQLQDDYGSMQKRLESLRVISAQL